jgi:hypothetical protein
MTVTHLAHDAERHARQQRFRRLNARLIEPGSMLLMLAGIVFLCQPWVELLHQYAVLVMLVGLIGFNIAVHVPPPEAERRGEEETGPVSIDRTVQSGGQHG